MREPTEAELHWIEARYQEHTGRASVRDRMTPFHKRWTAVANYASGIRFLRSKDGRTPAEREEEHERLRTWLKKHAHAGHFSASEGWTDRPGGIRKGTGEWPKEEDDG